MAHAVLQADQVQPVRRIARGAKHSAAGIGGSMRSTTAWPGIAGDARWTSMLVHKDSWNRFYASP